MSRKITLYCAECRNRFEKEIREYNRRVKIFGDEDIARMLMYCSLECAGYSAKIGQRWITKTCQCGTGFTTSTNNAYCSQSCASFYILTPDKKAAMKRGIAESGSHGGRFDQLTPEEHLHYTANSLRVREWSKYVAMSQELLRLDIDHIFEVPVGTRIFDLMLPEIQTVVEFDEPHHFYNKRGQPEDDAEKTEMAQRYGWKVKRIPAINLPIPYPVSLIQHLIAQHYPRNNGIPGFR